MLKQAIKAIIPRPILLIYHKILAILANIIYGFPSRKMSVIGVTGTKGKSSTVIMTTRILEEAGYKVGSMNTIFFKIGDKEQPNTTKQGMQGRFKLQKMLSQMIKVGCTHVVVEVTSEGISQHRQWGIAFDVVVFTNLGREHIEAHGLYENYRSAKEIIFKDLSDSYRKTISGQSIKKVIIANSDDSESKNFLRHKADEKWQVFSSCDHTPQKESGYNYLCAEQITQTDEGVNLTVQDQDINLHLHGLFMAQNALLAIAAANSLGVEFETSSKALEGIKVISGRAEVIDTKQGFKVIVDYAHEPKSFKAIFNTAKDMSGNGKIIAVFGATGGGRDTAKRPEMGKIAGQNADYIVLTNDDPYDSDEQSIIDDISQGITSIGSNWKKEKNWFSIIDREKAIQKALSLAKPGDLVLLLGKGSEKVIVIGDKHLPWSDRSVVEESLK
jgi:UDP-N-acetylmuramyl-tripeptide synthetase